ncbi:isoleucyl-tRNA synthetase [Apostasia shenzhenica]|uniref:Isoleucyl-tRNA synthetase n=1 Tax=Apostasia shenzhenica TaxID=1088818 RepID=A0A2I0A7N3_9ASPA|nr:isoleucyl-tRNA synthetase [Apostasia shenzhenica]
MLRWMCGYTRKDRMRNEYIRKKVGVAPIEDKLRESQLKWFGHLNRRPIEAPVRKKLSYWILPMYKEEDGDQRRHDKKL